MLFCVRQKEEKISVMYELLSNIRTPADLKKMSLSEMDRLCSEIRDFLISSVSKTGGHLASNLGVVELTVAMHTVFDMPEDKVVWDVGHQSYVHKILTGRIDGFDTLRQFGGLSGFPKRSESIYDCFDTGHSSTSLSAALGIATARDIAGDTYDVAAVFGDGALTGGMMYEALNHVGRSKSKLILILNDNEMSISRNVGAISNYLRNLRSKQSYYKSKQVIENMLNKIPVGGKTTARLLRAVKRNIRRMVLPTTLFDDLGIEYLGPVDGHDMSTLLNVLKRAKKSKKTVIIHVNTKKGKGYLPAEENPQKFHGISPVKPHNDVSDDYSAIFGKKLCALAGENKKIAAITGAMPLGTGLEEFSARFKQRFFDVGIAEQHAVTFAAGLACGGYAPVVAIYSSFLQRAYDQIIHDVCLQNLHVVLAVDRAGLVGADGETHQGLYDIAFLSHMPNMSILSPCNFAELEQMLEYAVNIHNTPIAVRYPRGKAQVKCENTAFEFGKADIIRNGKDAVIITAGRMVATAIKAADIALKHGIDVQVVSLKTIKPFDEETLLKCAAATRNVITIEDGVCAGGFGERIGAFLKSKDISCTFHAIGFPDEPIIHGNVTELDVYYGVDAKSVADLVTSIVRGDKHDK